LQVGLAGIGAAITLVLTVMSLMAMNVDLPLQEQVHGYGPWTATVSVLSSAALLLPAAGGGALWWRMRK
jgi:hypothetical protein